MIPKKSFFFCVLYNEREVDILGWNQSYGVTKIQKYGGVSATVYRINWAQF